MADRLGGEITIGGKLSKTASLDRFLMALREESVSLEWGGGMFCPSDWSEIQRSLDEGGRLHLYNDAARWGEFEELEKACVQLGLAFVRRSEAKYEYDAEVVFVTGEGPLEQVFTNASAQPVIGVAEITEAIKDADTDPAGAIQRIRKLLPPAIPEVPRLELVA